MICGSIPQRSLLHCRHKGKTMANKQQAIHDFWASFGWDAYEATSVPDNAQLPYITHEAVTSDFDRPVTMAVTLWNRSTGWKDVVDKEIEISSAIGRGGKVLAYTGGALWITKGTPFSFKIGDPDDDSVRGISLNTFVEYFD